MVHWRLATHRLKFSISVYILHVYCTLKRKIDLWPNKSFPPGFKWGSIKRCESGEVGLPGAGERRCCAQGLAMPATHTYSRVSRLSYGDYDGDVWLAWQLPPPRLMCCPKPTSMTSMLPLPLSQHACFHTAAFSGCSMSAAIMRLFPPPLFSFFLPCNPRFSWPAK